MGNTGGLKGQYVGLKWGLNEKGIEGRVLFGFELCYFLLQFLNLLLLLLYCYYWKTQD